MTEQEIEAMLRWRFAQAGGTEFPFESRALDYLYELSKGHPRNTCALAQLSLEVAAQGEGRITSAIINKVKDKRFLEIDKVKKNHS